MQRDDLRRIVRVSVCCRVDVRDHLGIWTAVTEDFCERGCRIVTGRLPRPGTVLQLRLSSDLFAEELEIAGRAMWGTTERVGVAFLPGGPDAGGITPADWLELVIWHGQACGGDAPSHALQVVPALGHARLGAGVLAAGAG